MSHEHIVSDSDSYFVINPTTRQIINSSGNKILIQNDHNSERFTFEIPRYVDGHDMTLCDKVEIHYDNKESSGYYESENVYPVTDLHVPSASENTAVFTWLISRNATKYAGSLQFAIHFECVTDDVIEYRWSTDVYDKVTIEESIINDLEIEDYEYSGTLESLKTVIDDTLSVAGAAADAKAVGDAISAIPISVNEETGYTEITGLPRGNTTVFARTDNTIAVTTTLEDGTEVNGTLTLDDTTGYPSNYTEDGHVHTFTFTGFDDSTKEETE